MRRTQFALAGAFVLSAMALPAAAQIEEPGSLLIFPEFDNRTGVENLWTITNTSSTEHVVVEIIYIGLTTNPAQPCPEFNRNILLTPNDTFTFLTRFHNPNQLQGFAYAFAKLTTAGPAIKFDHLIGNAAKIDFGVTISKFNYSTNPFVFKAAAGLGHRAPTDVAPTNGHKDLNGQEYEYAPDEILVPRFLGQAPWRLSRLILIALSGGSRFDTTVDFLIYNDNEEVFSSEYTFRCWEQVYLHHISGIFENDFLSDFTNNDPLEVFGAPLVQSGWMRLKGAVANSTSASIPDPAILAVLVEGILDFRGADLPYGQGQREGRLFPRSNTGN